MFSKRGITAFDEEGNALVIDSCWEGNEEVCTGYEGCLVLTLTGPKPTPSSPALNSSSATPSLFAPPPPTASPVTTVPATARPKPSSQSTKLTSKPTELIGSFSEVDSIAPAPLEAITKACTGTEKTNLLSRGDEETQAECVSFSVLYCIGIMNPSFPHQLYFMLLLSQSSAFAVRVLVVSLRSLMPSVYPSLMRPVNSIPFLLCQRACRDLMMTVTPFLKETMSTSNHV